MKTCLSIISLMAALVLLSACSTTVRYDDPNAVETTTTGFGSTDLQTTAKKMIDGLLSFPPIVQLTNQRRPVIFVDKLRNKTEEHIDTEAVNDTVMTGLLQSGKFRFVDMSAVDSVKTQLRYQQDSGLVDPATAVKVGRQIGAQYMLYGSISSIVKKAGSTTDTYYLITMKLLNLQTGIVEWMDQKQIRKTATRSLFGW